MIRQFAYRSVNSLDDAVAALAPAWGKSAVLAGGTDLVNLMKEGLETPETVVNIKDIRQPASLHGIVVEDTVIKIGATTTLAEIAEHAAIGRHLPALADACAAIGGPQIRNMGTLGGSLCQRPRDWYFRNSIQSADRTENQYGAVIPIANMDYVHPSTTAPALIAYGAKVKRHAPGASTETKIEEFFQVSDLKAKRETTLKPNEIVTGVEIPVIYNLKSANYEIRERSSHDWPLVQAAVAVEVFDGKVKSARVVLGHVAPLPVLVKAAGDSLVGKELNEAAATAAGKLAAADAKPIGKAAYKVALIQVAVKRALLAAVGNAYWKSK